MFFETAFGICIGRKLPDLPRPEQAQACPGGTFTYTPCPLNTFDPARQ